MGRLSTRTLVSGVFAAAFVLVCAGVADAQAVKGGLVGNIVDASEARCPASR